MTHTPTPWKTENSRTIQTESGEFYLGYLKDKDGNAEWKAAYAELDANTRHIVRCVNSHDALVEALRFLLNPENVCLIHAKGGEACNRAQVDEMVKKAKAALTHAEKGA